VSQQSGPSAAFHSHEATSDISLPQNRAPQPLYDYSTNALESSTVNSFNQPPAFSFSHQNEASGTQNEAPSGVAPAADILPTLAWNDQSDIMFRDEESFVGSVWNHGFTNPAISDSHTPLAFQGPTFAPAVDDSITTRVSNEKELKSSGPMSRDYQLPPARRGGRKSALSSVQLKQRKDAKAAGVCIRCRKSGVKV